MTSHSSKQPSAHVTEARAAAQRAKLDAQAQRRHVAARETATQAKQAKGKNKQAALLSKRRASTQTVCQKSKQQTVQLFAYSSPPAYESHTRVVRPTYDRTQS